MSLEKRYKLNLDVFYCDIQSTNICFTQGDVGLNIIDIFINKKSIQTDISNAVSAEIVFKKPDGNITKSNTGDTNPRLTFVDKATGEMKYILSSQDIAYQGENICTLSLFDADDNRITTSRFNMKVIQYLDSDGLATTSESVNSFNQRITFLEQGGSTPLSSTDLVDGANVDRLDEDQTASGVNTYTNGIKTNKISSESGSVNVEIVETGDDAGLAITGGQFSVGVAEKGEESIFGEGDSVPIDLAFHYDSTTETGLTIPSATDITDILKSDSGSTVAMFESNTVDQVILVGKDTPPAGVKVKWDFLGDLEASSIVGEYLRNDNTWAESTYMVTGSNYPYTRYSNKIASELSEQIRFGMSILNPNLDFELKTLNINGVNHTKYWVRLRLVATATVMPVIEQVKSHTNRTEINKEGVVEFFGRARGLKNIEVLETANSANDPANENINLFSGGLNGGISKLVDNEFASNALDSRIFLAKVDENVDTSTPIVLSVPFYVKGTGTGDINFFAEIVQLTDPFTYGTLTTPNLTLSKIISVESDSNLLRQVLQFEIPVDKINPNVGGVYIVVSRDARASNPNDTLGNSVILTGSSAEGRRWRL